MGLAAAWALAAPLPMRVGVSVALCMHASGSTAAVGAAHLRMRTHANLPALLFSLDHQSGKVGDLCCSE